MDQISSENLKWSVWGLRARPWGRWTTILRLLIGLQVQAISWWEPQQSNQHPPWRLLCSPTHPSLPGAEPGCSQAVPETGLGNQPAPLIPTPESFCNLNIIPNNISQPLSRSTTHLSPPWSRSPPSSLCSILNSANSNSFCLCIVNASKSARPQVVLRSLPAPHELQPSNTDMLAAWSPRGSRQKWSGDSSTPDCAV